MDNAKLNDGEVKLQKTKERLKSHATLEVGDEVVYDNLDDHPTLENSFDGNGVVVQKLECPLVVVAAIYAFKNGLTLDGFGERVVSITKLKPVT